MPGPQTTWTDLANLGWYKNNVYNAVNKQRGGSMEGLGDMALNESFANDWGWYSYNDLKGDPRKDGPVFTDLPQDDTIVWQYDNTGNNQPFTDKWTEKWTNTESASLSIRNAASISLKQSINIQGICNTEFGFSIETESTETKTAQQSYELSHTFDIVVNRREIVKLVRTQSIRQGSQKYYQDYGLDPNNNRIATKGKKWNGHYYYGVSLNTALNSPSGTMTLVGTTKKVTFQFTLTRTGPNGRTVHEPIVVVKDTQTKVITVNEDTAQALTPSIPEEAQAPIPGIPKDGTNNSSSEVV